MDQSFYKSYFELEKHNWWFKGRRELILRLLTTYGRREGLKVLDVGCGSGYLVGLLQRDGYDAYGIDVSEEAINLGTEKGIKNLKVVPGERIEFPDNQFDRVLALDTIEHISDDHAAIKEIDRVLAPGGIAIVTVPAYMWMWGLQDEVAHHYRRYTLKSLLKLASSASGLQVKEKTYFNTFLFPPAALIRLFSRWFNLKSRESDFDLNSNFLNNLLFFIFKTELSLLKFVRYPFGVSILLVLKKHDQPIQK